MFRLIVKDRLQWLVTVFFISILILGISLQLVLDSDFGRLEVRTVEITDGITELSGLLYRSYAASSQNQFPSIIIAHGISESKEMMSNLGLELARRDFVVLCLDLLGHGESGGTIAEGQQDPTFGVQAAIKYLRAQPFVNSSNMGLVGHSLGGGAVRAATAKDSSINALVLIAGGLDTVPQGQQYDVLNATFPKNLMVIVGDYDVLFNITDLATRQLLYVFNTNQQVIPSLTYGSFQSQTARLLFTPATSHLFEPSDSSVIINVISWMQNSLRTGQGTGSVTNMIYWLREVAALFSLVALFGLFLLAYIPVSKLLSLKSGPSAINMNYVFKKPKSYTIWAALNLVLFLPMVFVGFAVSFPPSVFGASIAWWLFAVGLVGLVIISIRANASARNAWNWLRGFFNGKEALIAVILFFFLLAVVSVFDATLGIVFRILSPIFRSFTSLKRFIIFPTFLPFFLVYFCAEGFYLHMSHDSAKEQRGGSARNEIWDCLGSVIGKIGVFLVVLALQYLPKIFLGIWILPNYIGFLMEFLWVITPIFALSTISSWWLNRNTNNVTAGAVLNALIMAWVAAVVFPF
jgi:dienelactone hydrolase